MAAIEASMMLLLHHPLIIDLCLRVLVSTLHAHLMFQVLPPWHSHAERSGLGQGDSLAIEGAVANTFTFRRSDPSSLRALDSAAWSLSARVSSCWSQVKVTLTGKD